MTGAGEFDSYMHEHTATNITKRALLLRYNKTNESYLSLRAAGSSWPGSGCEIQRTPIDDGLTSGRRFQLFITKWLQTSAKVHASWPAGRTLTRNTYICDI